MHWMWVWLISGKLTVLVISMMLCFISYAFNGGHRPDNWITILNANFTSVCMCYCCKIISFNFYLMSYND